MKDETKYTIYLVSVFVMFLAGVIAVSYISGDANAKRECIEQMNKRKY